MKKLIYGSSIIALLMLAGCGDTTEAEPAKENNQTTAASETKTAETVETENKVETDDVYFKDDEVKLVDLKIKITDTKVIPVGEPGNEYGDKPAFAIWYDTTNLSDKDIDPMTAWMVVFEAIQDNDPNAVNTLNVGMLPDHAFLDSQMQTIKKDGTVANAVAYELDDLETPVKLVATQGVAGKKLGEIEFPVK